MKDHKKLIYTECIIETLDNTFWSKDYRKLIIRKRFSHLHTDPFVAAVRSDGLFPTAIIVAYKKEDYELEDMNLMFAHLKKYFWASHGVLLAHKVNVFSEEGQEEIRSSGVPYSLVTPFQIDVSPLNRTL